MIVQTSMVRNELLLIKELLPIWKKYADGFIFMLHSCNDGTYEYLKEVKDQYNILEILTINKDIDDELWVETDVRGLLFTTAKKYSNNIICLDADEYLDGSMTKEELLSLLELNRDTTFHLKWIQYTSVNTIRIDGPWKDNIKDRMGSYSKECQFKKAQTHSTHLPITENQKIIDSSQLFVAHLQWLDKNHVAIKQYFWKVTDYINNKKHGIEVAGNLAYDQSVNNFNWEEEYFDYQLKIREDIFEDQVNSENYRVEWINNNTKKYEVPNLNDWGYNIHDSIPMYFCTAADEKHYPLLINMIGSLHKFNYYDIVEIRVYDIGLNQNQKAELKNIKKVKVCDIEKTNSQILEYIQTSETKFSKGAFSWKPVVIKDSLDHQPYTLYLDAGTTILKPVNNIFKHIKQNGYLLFDCGHSIKWMTTKYVIDSQNLNLEENKWILDDNVFGIDAGFQGISRSLYDSYVLPVYNLTKDINNFLDDKTCPDGFGCARQDQTLFSIQARKLGLDLIYHDNKDKNCYLKIDGHITDFHITHTKSLITDNTSIYRSRWDMNYDSFKTSMNNIKRRYIISVVTAIGKLDKYEKFIDQYFSNIKNQNNFNKIEFIIVYSEWSDKFNSYKELSNIKFIKEDEPKGMYNAWNIGILNATSEYITNWNIDDIRFDINNVIKYHLLSKNLNVDMAYNYYIGVTEKELESDLDINEKKYIHYPDEFHTNVLSMCMAGPDPMWRKSFHLFYGLFNYKDYSVIGDWEMWVRMASKGLKFKLIPHPLCIYVAHDNTVSSTNIEASEKQKQTLFNQYTK
jgi:hypothetical protein